MPCLYIHNMTINWGIIGCGDVTEVKSGPAFSKVPDSQLVAVMRRNAGLAEGYARRHSVARWYTSAEALIADPEVNAVYIATPPDSHETYTLKILESGKPVYVEKPMARNAAEAQRMVDSAKGSGSKLSIAHYRRAQPKFIKIKELIASGTIGKITSASFKHFQSTPASLENSWRLNPDVSGGGLFHDLAPHQLDLMLYFLGDPVYEQAVERPVPGVFPQSDLSAEIEFGGIPFKGHWNFNSADTLDECVVNGTKGSLHFAVFGDKCELQFPNEKIPLSFPPLPHVQQPMIEQVVNYFLDRGPNPCPASEGLKVMKLMDAVCAGAAGSIKTV